MKVYSWRNPIVLPLSLWLVLMLGSVTILNAEGSADLTTLERQVHELVNHHRMAMGLAPLGYSEDIARVARRHSRDMADGYVGMGHEGADKRGLLLARAIAYSKFAENVASNNFTVSATAQTAVAGWLNSLGHKANIEGNFNLTGIGVAYNGNTFFFTQIFLTATQSTLPSVEPPRMNNRTSERDSFPKTEQSEPSSHRRRAYTSSREEESDPRNRPGRTRVHGGYVQSLDLDH
jgi:hypothetical protein